MVSEAKFLMKKEEATVITSDTLSDVLTRLALTPCNESRAATLGLALAAGASDDVLRMLCDAQRVSRKPTVVLPAHRYEGLSRGRGWARKGRGDKAEWGEREDNGYRVGPGKWTVGGNDGFSRKGEDTWDVKHVQVGDEVWTVAS